MTVRIIDVETTGTDASEDAVIEIASVDLSKQRDHIDIHNPMQTFVSTTRPIPAVASAVHHILEEDLIGAPPLAEAIDQFKGAHAYVAHNCEFEQGFLGAHLVDVPWICTFKCALRLWPDFASHSNQALRYALGLARPFSRRREDIHPHRAASDVIVTAAILVEALSLAPYSQLLVWSNEPTLHTRFTFGKHRGERYDEHLDYCDWILGQKDMDAGVRFSAEYWIKKASEKQE